MAHPFSLVPGSTPCTTKCMIIPTEDTHFRNWATEAMSTCENNLLCCA
jgi:hypothetical protein